MMTVAINTLETGQVWMDHKNELAAFIRSKVKDKTEAEDILQEVFIKIHLHLKSLSHRQHLKAWVYQIARNVVWDHYRKQKYFASPDQIVQVPEEAYEKYNGSLNCLGSFISKLPEKYRQAVILSDLKQIEQTRLAVKWNISYSAAKSRVQRARQMLRKYFSECCNIIHDKYGHIISHEPKSNCRCSGAGAC
jgi:RNA polymerase sigma-70 factor (ECF subfamily)